MTGPISLFWVSLLCLSGWPEGTAPTPKSTDPRLVVEPFALAPAIVHPIAIDVDRKGRVLVVESHTHFRPAGYEGPKADRIRILRDTDGKGRANQIETFFEGTTATMDLAIHPDGSVYLATRNEILRLVDENDDGKADRSDRIVFLDTKGNYPHNGLSGLVFDERGDLFFGMGENLGEPYLLKGADGKTIRGGGEGGRMFHCDRLGKGLRSVATGFWNPFGAGRDVFNRVFVVDNDPDASPPCRLIHLVQGGDYGFQFRYGRSGRHVFQSWNGELKGTLPYVSGTGESPCEALAYESDGLPPDYRGHWLVPVWADHRIERYELQPQGASFQATRKPFLQGGKDFRPSGIAVAPDGSLFVTDWVSQSYELHGKGAIWRIRSKEPRLTARPTESAQALLHPDRTTRETAAGHLAASESGRAILRTATAHQDARIRASALTALAIAQDSQVNWSQIASNDPEPGLREWAVKTLHKMGQSVDSWADSGQPPGVRAMAIQGLSEAAARSNYPKLLGETDPFLFHAAIDRLARSPELLKSLQVTPPVDPQQRAGLLLAWAASAAPDARKAVTSYLKDSQPEIRFLALKVISDQNWQDSLAEVKTIAANDQLDHRTVIGVATTLARLEGQPINEDALVGRFEARVRSQTVPATAKIVALRAIPGQHPRAKTLPWDKLLADASPKLRVEALRILREATGKTQASLVRSLALNRDQPDSVRCQAIATLAAMETEPASFFLALTQSPREAIRAEALRGLVGSPLEESQKMTLKSVSQTHPGLKPLVDRLLKNEAPKRPSAKDLDAWLARYADKGDPETGRRVFEHPRLANCAKCHAVDGRGARVGPDLSLMGKTDRRWLLESLLQPANSIAPHYQSFTIETADGRLRAGILQRTYLDESTFIDQQGQPFTVQATDLVGMTPRKDSLMPEGLLDILTDKEIVDLLSFLETRKPDAKAADE